ncbi:MAG: hypothetical protein Q8S71_11945 [Hydrogenophaga sp.]|nr:hypothetical protein [Hydrogenophaga sp.]
MKTTARLIATLALAAAAAFGLTACESNPAKPEPAAPVVAKTTVDLLLEVRSKELDLERTNQMAWLKFAAESDSEMVKGFVMGKSSGASAGASSTTQSIMQAQAQADETALRREQMAAENSLENKAFRWVGLGLDFARFRRGMSFQKFQVRENNAQQRYTLDTVANTSLISQQAGYDFNSRQPYFFSLPAGSQGVEPVADTPATE